MDQELASVLQPLSILGALGFAMTIFTRTLTDYILKKKMIDKGYVNEETQALFRNSVPASPMENRYPSLKWGLIIFFAGISLILLEYIPHAVDSPLPYGLFAVSVSLGFLLYYALMKREQK